MASYLVEGGPSKEHAKTKAMMYGAPDVWDALMRKIAGIAAAYLRVQVDAGASAVQLFDSLGGRHVAAGLPALRHAVLRVGAGGGRRARRARGSTSGSAPASCSGLMGEAGADVVGVDWRVPLAEGVRRVGGRAVQGNLDPSLVFAPTEVMLARAAEVLDAGRAAPGHIFNLGHGVLPSTDPDQLARLTDFVHEHSARDALSRHRPPAVRPAACIGRCRSGGGPARSPRAAPGAPTSATTSANGTTRAEQRSRRRRGRRSGRPSRSGGR